MPNIISNHRSAFTLVELLVVIGIIALLIGMLIPALARVRQNMQQVQCAAQLQQIGMGVQMYTMAYRGVLNYSQSGALWVTPTSSSPAALISDQAAKPYAYWGVAYAPFLIPRATLEMTGDHSAAILGAAKKLWRCPTAAAVDPALVASADDPISYAINGLITGSIAPRWRRMSRYGASAEIVFAQDSMKTQMKLNQFDTLSNFGSGNNLRDWRPGGGPAMVTDQGVREYYRHRGWSNVLWLDGHVSPLQMSSGDDIPKRYYRPLGVDLY